MWDFFYDKITDIVSDIKNKFYVFRHENLQMGLNNFGYRLIENSFFLNPPSTLFYLINSFFIAII